MTKQEITAVELEKLTSEIVAGKGYVLIRDLLSREEAKATRDLLLKLAEKERAANQSNLNTSKQRLYGLIYQSKALENLVQNPIVLSVIEAILGEDAILGGFSAHILYPGAQRMGVHVDYPYWAMSSPFPKYPILEIQVIWMIEDFTEDNGAPLFAPATQKLAIKPDLEQFERTAQKITGTAGTAIISHGLCWHDTSVNNSDCPRVSLLGNYTPQYIHPLENNLFDRRQEVIDRATPKLKQLLRHDLSSEHQRVFAMNFKMT